MSKKILVAYATKHGATAGIAERIAEILKKSGLDAYIMPVAQVKGLSAYSAVVLGSASYVGSWRKDASRFLKENEIELSKRKVWLFSSGPTGEGDVEKLMGGWTFPPLLKKVADRIKPVGITTFKGAVEPEKLGAVEKWMATRVKSGVGDFRDWDRIEGWAKGIAKELKN